MPLHKCCGEQPLLAILEVGHVCRASLREGGSETGFHSRVLRAHLHALLCWPIQPSFAATKINQGSGLGFSLCLCFGSFSFLVSCFSFFLHSPLPSFSLQMNKYWKGASDVPFLQAGGVSTGSRAPAVAVEAPYSPLLCQSST